MTGGSQDPGHTEEKPPAEMKSASRMAESISGQVDVRRAVAGGRRKPRGGSLERGAPPVFPSTTAPFTPTGQSRGRRIYPQKKNADQFSR